MEFFSFCGIFAILWQQCLCRTSFRAAFVSLEQLARIGCNPFYPYLEKRLLAWLEPQR